MPNLDMPLNELKQYQGRNPKPKDFDEFWDTQIAKLDNIDPKVELKKVNLNSKIANAYELRFTSTQGARIYAKMVKPKNVSGKMPAVLSFHGLGGSSFPFYGMLTSASQGYCSFCMDARGQGGFSQDVGGPGSTQVNFFMRGFDGTPEQMYGVNLFLDTAMLVKVAKSMDFIDGDKLAVTGGSQGGGLAIACAALCPEIKLCATHFPYMSDYKRVYEMGLAQNCYGSITEYFRRYDPKHEREDEIFTKLGYIDLQHLSPRIKAEVLMATGLMDDTCPPSTQFAIYNKITSKKQVLIYPDYGHEIPHEHEDAVFNFLSKL